MLASVVSRREPKMLRGSTLSMRVGGITADADLSPTRWTAAIQQAKQRGVKPLVSESGLFFRVPITNDVATYFIDQKYDGRDAESLTEAEIHGREQARAYLQAIRTIPGCEHAYILATGPEIGTRESRHVNARYSGHDTGYRERSALRRCSVPGGVAD